jgi:hypothetical protein
MAWVLIATDDFVHLKRGFATVDGRRLSTGTKKPSRGRRPHVFSAV